MEDHKRILKQFRMGTTELLILLVLSRRDQYGYEITRTVHDKSGGYFDLKQGFLYPTLQRMEGAKLVRSYWRGSDSRGPDRRYYRLTAKGKTFMAESLGAWKDFSRRFTRTISAIQKK